VSDPNALNLRLIAAMAEKTAQSVERRAVAQMQKWLAEIKT
jgi:hypothetical protein